MIGNGKDILYVLPETHFLKSVMNQLNRVEEVEVTNRIIPTALWTGEKQNKSSPLTKSNEQ